jgi:hypothetical protein
MCACFHLTTSTHALRQAVMVVADETHSLQITGNGDVLEPHDGIIGALRCAVALARLHAHLHADVTAAARSYRLGRAIRAGGSASAHRHPRDGCDGHWCVVLRWNLLAC